MGVLKSVNLRETKGTASYVVASVEATAEQKRTADYVCDGVADQVQIQAAINKIADVSAYGDVGDNGKVYLVGTGFYISSAIAMRRNVSLEAIDANHGTSIKITDGSNCNGIEIAHVNGKGTAGLKGIYVEGNNTNNSTGSGFVMPSWGISVYNDSNGGEITAATVQVVLTGTPRIIFKEDGSPTYTINLSRTPGTMITEIIDVVDGNDGWHVTNVSGYNSTHAGVFNAAETAACTTLSSAVLAAKAETGCLLVGNIQYLALGKTFDYFFHRCMQLHSYDTGFFIGRGHSIHFDRCVSEYTENPAGHGFYINSIACDGIRMHGCYGTSNDGDGYYIDSAWSTLIGCLAIDNDGNGFTIDTEGVVLNGCNTIGLSSQTPTVDTAGIRLGTNSTGCAIAGCTIAGAYDGIRNLGSLNTITGNFIKGASGVCRYGIYIGASYNVVGNNVIRDFDNYGIYHASTLGYFANNMLYNNKGGDANEQGICAAGNNSIQNNRGWKGDQLIYNSAASPLTMDKHVNNQFLKSGLGEAAQVNLPVAAIGMRHRFLVGVAQEFRIKAQAGEIITLAAGAGEAGEYITANAANESIVLKCEELTKWIVDAGSENGTWTHQP